jgi:hypothetical protein
MVKGIITTTHAHNDSSANASCPTCQGNENMRRQIDDEADAEARKRFRLFVVLYLAYPAIILSLLGVIAAGAYVYLKGDSPEPMPIASQPPWCYPGSMAGYGPPASSSPSGGFEPAIAPSGSFTPNITPQIGIQHFNTVQVAGNSARERTPTTSMSASARRRRTRRALSAQHDRPQPSRTRRRPPEIR